VLHPGTLHDGAAVQALLRGVDLGGDLLLTDEGTFGYGEDPMLGYLVRRYPAGLERSSLVSVAALAADRPDGTPVVEALADQHAGGDLEGFLRGYLRVLFGVHLRLWLEHGIALEAHQQNTALVLDGARIRLLLKDNDTPRLDPELLAAAGHGDLLAALADRRIVDGGPQRLADMVTTVVLHLDAAAVLVGVAQRRGEPVGRWLRLVREELADVARTYRGCRDFPLLQRILDAPRLPVKSMVTAGTLLPKERTGAVDVNTCYGTTAPSYLLDPGPC
jgi:siderophore synthetase component